MYASLVGELHSHGATQPCIQAKSTRHPRGCVGRSPTIYFILFLFFSCKNHLIQVKEAKTVNKTREKDNETT
jgi:hypothetical protein